MDQVDDEVVRRLKEAAPLAFEDEPVVFAYLFGSRATGRTHARSDVDVAVYLDPSVTPELAFKLRLRLPNRTLDASGVGNVEVAVLNELPLPVRGRAVRDGIVIYSRDEPARIRFESRTLREFFDFEIHARPLTQELLQRIAEGRR